MSIKSRIISSVLIPLLLLPSCAVFSSCGSKSSENAPAEEQTTTAAEALSEETLTEIVEEETYDSLEARMQVDDGVPDADYGGRDFCTLCHRDETFYLADEETGEVMNDAIFRRNSTISERFNVTFSIHIVSWDTLASVLRTSVQSGDDAYQLMSGHVIMVGDGVRNNIYANWYDIPHIDFDKPWWPDSNQEDLTYNGKAFIVVGDYAISAISKTYCVYFNKMLAEAYNLPDMYDVVSEGKWTADQLFALSKDVYVDENGNGQADNEDVYGFGLYARSPINAFLYAFGEKIVKKQEDGTLVLDYYNEKVTSIYDKLYQLTWGAEGVYARGETTDLEPINNMFLKDQILFLPQCFDLASSSLRELETDYGIIPLPKWDETQQDYYTMVDGGHDGLAVPISVTDREFVGAVTEALTAESWKRVTPAYYDVVLKTRGTRDQRSVDMIDYILDHRVFDFGYVYGVWGAAFWVQYVISEGKSSDIASYYASHHKAFDKSMRSVFEYFDEFENGN